MKTYELNNAVLFDLLRVHSFYGDQPRRFRDELHEGWEHEVRAVFSKADDGSHEQSQEQSNTYD